MKSVYFHQKRSHRERQRDTYLIGKSLVHGSSPLQEFESNISIEKGTQKWFSKIISKLLAILPIINLRNIEPTMQDIDYIYTWGDIPLRGKIPYIIELDNPSILTLYNSFALKLYKPVIRWLLGRKECHKIVCISEACRQVTIDVLGKSFSEKIHVLSPFIKKRENISPKDGKIRFVSIGLRRTGKGINETLAAFHRLTGDNLELHIIGWRDAETENLYRDDTRMIFHGPIERTRVLEELLPGFDVLVFPSIYESLGMVALESLGSGLGIITTDTFALGECTENGYNGILLENPYLSKTLVGGASLINVTEMTADAVYKKYNLSENTLDEKFEKSIYSALVEAREKSAEWKKNSEILFEKKYSETRWKDTFLSLI